MSSKPKTAKEIAKEIAKEKETAKEAEIYSVLREFFPEPNHIETMAVKTDEEDDGEEKKEAYRYPYIFLYKIIMTEGLGCEMIIKFLGDKDIYIDELFKCGLNGRQQTLNIIVEIAKQLNYKKISLVDNLQIQVYPKFDIQSYIYEILTEGQSWYNSLGYHSYNYEQEEKDNAKFPKMKITEFQDDVGSKLRAMNKLGDNNNYTINLNNLLTIFPGLDKSEKDDMTVSVFYKKIMEFIDSDEPDIKKKKKKLNG